MFVSGVCAYGLTLRGNVRGQGCANFIAGEPDVKNWAEYMIHFSKIVDRNYEIYNNPLHYEWLARARLSQSASEWNTLH